MSVTPEYYLEPIVNDEWTGGAPTRAIIDYLVGHGFLIDTAAMDRGEMPTIMHEQQLPVVLEDLAHPRRSCASTRSATSTMAGATTAVGNCLSSPPAGGLGGEGPTL